MLTFWTIAIILTAIACLAVLLPVSRPKATAEASESFDIEVYRDQLAEVDADNARGLIGGTEAAEARAEIGRRILQTKDAENPEGSGGGNSGKWLASIAILSIPLVAVAIYSVTGSPDLPAQPLQARLDKNPAENTIDELIARAESHLADNPEDSRGWDVIAPIYVRVNRYAEAENAYRNAIRIGGNNARRLTGLGETLLGLNQGVITLEASELFEQALDIEPRNSKARFFLAMAKAQRGQDAEAIELWRSVVADAPEQSPWRPAALSAISAVENRTAQADGSGQPGPDAADIAAAEEMTAEDRSAMIESMVAGLASKLEENPHDEEGWRRLIRSYVVLGRNNDAREALNQAVAALREKPELVQSLTEFAAGLGIVRVE
ncbi:MAG: c-type cytochrome biogenesis protein CcmI [Rhizobiaceae bacterium]